jgi:ABC-2 type transport system permease protein
VQPILAKLGVSLRKGMLVQPDKKFIGDLVFCRLTDSARNMSPQFAKYVKSAIRYYGDTIPGVKLQGASAIDLAGVQGYHTDTLLLSDSAIEWNRVLPVSHDSLILGVTRLPSDEHGNFPTAIRMWRNVQGKNQRIIITGDADFISETQINNSNTDENPYNNYFGFWNFSYLTYGKFPANTLRPEGTDNRIRISVDSIPIQKWIFYCIIPALIVLIASVILIRRKRK